MPEQRYTVFVSSSWLDNRERRERVRAAIEQAGMVPVGMERFAAQARPALEVCLEEAREADVLVCILARRYGSIAPGTGRSFTELEYEESDERIVLTIDPTLPYTERELDPGPVDERYEKQKLLARFRERIRSDGALYREFDEMSLQADVLHALNTWKARKHAERERGDLVGGAGPEARDVDAAEDAQEHATPEPPARVALDAAVAASAPPALDWNRPECPYPGLGAYDEDRAALYAGREKDLAEVGEELARRLAPGLGAEPCWIQIEGASGAGKSSFARAGLAPMLRAWTEEGSLGRFRIAVLRPGTEPLRNVALALARAFPGEATEALERRLRESPDALRNLLAEKLDAERGEHLALVLDQLEELFTHAPSAEDAPELARRHAAELDALADNLARALAPSASLVLVTTVRRDYLGELARLASLDALTNRAHRCVLGALDARALEAAIRRPAEAAGLSWSAPELPVRIAREAAEVAGGLALLGHALEALWQRREGATLTESAYDEIGGVAGALGGQACELAGWLATLSRPGEELPRALRSAMLSLVRVEPDGRVARKILPRAQFLAATGLPAARAEWLLAVLTGARVPELAESAPPLPRLLAVSGAGAEARVEIVHELLLVTWCRATPGGPPGLSEWIAEERERLLVRERFEAHAREWAAAGAPLLAVDSGHLYRRYQRSGSTDPDALRFLAAARKKRVLLRCVAAAALLLGLVAGARWWRDLQLERFDAELQYRLETLRTWRDPLLPRFVDGALAPADLTAFERLSHTLSERQLARVRARRAALESLERRSPFDAFTLETARALETEAERLRASLEDLGALPSPLTAEGRAELLRLWAQVKGTDGYQDLLPRYDFHPLRYRAIDEGKPYSWQFLVLGTGHEPEWDASESRWTFTKNTGIVVTYLPEGKFLMGSPPDVGPSDERTPSRSQRWVSLSPFYLAVTEWTLGHEARLSLGLVARDEREASALPLNSVDWFGAKTRATRVSARLPTEAQWEFACRAGTGTRWFHGDEEAGLEDYAWYGANSGSKLHGVATQKANAWGLHDMHGNAWEWCADWYAQYPEEEEARDPLGPPSGGTRVMRGGAYWDVADGCRSAFRGGWLPTVRFVVFGFRVAFPAAPELGARAVDD